jgi:hypothetical protein
MLAPNCSTLSCMTQSIAIHGAEVSGIRTHHLFGSRSNQPLSCALFPAFEWQSIVYALHRDTVLDRTNQGTEIAADTMVFIDARDAFKRCDRVAAAHSSRVELRNRSRRNVPCCVCLDHCRGSCRVWSWRRPIQMNALMCSVPARRVAKLASDTQIFVNPRNDLIVQIELLPFTYIGKR